MNEMMKTIIKDYMRQLFYFSLKKTSDTYEAEELTQDIILEVIKSLNVGIIPVETKAWVWKIARNRYASWVKQRAKIVRILILMIYPISLLTQKQRKIKFSINKN